MRIQSGILALGLLGTACQQATEPGKPGAGAGKYAPEGKPKVETTTGGMATKDGIFLEGVRVVENTALAKVTDEPWIGVVPAGDPIMTACPEGWVAIRMDDEDNANRNSFTYNSVPWTSASVRAATTNSGSTGRSA